MTTSPSMIENLCKRLTDLRGYQLWLLWLALVVLYAITGAHNLSETDDVYAFAYRAEHFSWDHVSDPRLMLYHMLSRWLYLGLSMLGLPVTGLMVISGLSLLSAAGVLILLTGLLVQHYKVSPPAACAAAVMLGISYGFWRYANEGDVYVPAMMLILCIWRGILNIAEKPSGINSGSASVWGCLAGLTVLFYQPSAIPLLLVFPWLWVIKRQIRLAFLYGFSATLIIVAGYLAGFYLYWPDHSSLNDVRMFLAQRSEEFIIPTLTFEVFLRSILQSAFALGHDILASHWVFGIDQLFEQIQHQLPRHDLHEERFLAEHMGRWRYIAPITCVAALVAGALLLFRAGLSWRRWQMSAPIAVTLLWTLVNGAIVGRMNAAGVEAWISVLLPLALLFGVWIAETLTQTGRERWLLVTLLLFALHNGLSGIFWVYSDDYEFEKVRGDWAIAQTQKNDLVIVTDQADLAEALRYHCAAEVVLMRGRDASWLAGILLRPEVPTTITIKTYGRDFAKQNIVDKVQHVRLERGRIILFSEFFKKHRLPKLYAADKAALIDNGQKDLDQLTTLIDWVYTDATGGRTGVFQWGD